MHSVNREYAWMTAAVRIAEVRKSCTNHVNNATGFEADIQTLRGIREPSVWCETVQGVCCSPQSFCREAGETCFNIKSFPCISCKRKPALRALSGFVAHIQCCGKATGVVPRGQIIVCFPRLRIGSQCRIRAGVFL